MRRLIMPKGLLGGLAPIVAVVALVELAIAGVGSEFVKDFETTCVPTEWKKVRYEARMSLELICGDKIAYLKNPDTLVRYLLLGEKAPRTLACKVYKSGEATCSVP